MGIRFDHNGEQWDLTFRHLHDGQGMVTEAVIRNLDENATECEFVEYAVCHPKDQFVKAIGRKVALERVLGDMPREFRRAAWTAYHQRRVQAKAVCPTQTGS